MKFSNPFKKFTKFEWGLWIISISVVVLSFVLPKEKDVWSLIASLIGVTALIFVAKGMVIGQILCVVFAVFYGIVALSQRYYGEMITYLGMSAPMAISATISWLKNPFKGSGEVTVRKTKPKEWLLLCVLAVIATVVFYFVLRVLGTANLPVSTISVVTSFFAASLVFLRSPYYALAYSANDLVLVVLWLLACFRDISYLPMMLCFVMFLCNDLYAFFNWRKMEKRQSRVARMQP